MYPIIHLKPVENIVDKNEEKACSTWLEFKTHFSTMAILNPKFEFLRHLLCLCQLQLMRKHSNDGGDNYMTQL